MSNELSGSTTVVTMPEDFAVEVTNGDFLKSAEVTYDCKPVNRIRIVLYKDDKVFDSFSFSTRPKSVLLKNLVADIGKVITARNKKAEE